jgi:hypothetical protein
MTNSFQLRRFAVVALFLIAVLRVLSQSNLPKEAKDAVSVVTAYAPHYPPIALAEGAAEDIQVKVVINEKGEVLDAKALSGVNTFLKSESEKTAKEWVFSKTDAARSERILHFNYVVLYPAQDIGPDVEFSMPFKVTIQQHQRETSGPSRRK